MAKNLVIVESPAKSRTLGKYLGSEYLIKASMGHIIDLPAKEFGISIEDNFKPKYIPMPGKAKVIREIQEAARKAQCVFLAPDPDREGEAIAWHVSTVIGDSTPIKRVLFNEITKRAVLAAIASPREIDRNLVNAQQARRILDRIVGYRVSPVLWKTLYKGLSAGRVQSVALRMICERECDIKAFKPQEYWTLEVELKTKNGKTIIARLAQVNGEKANLPNQQRTDAVMAALAGKPFTVSSVQQKEKYRQPSPPFITSTLQQEAARRLHYSAAKTMLIAQQLYEGLEVGAPEPVGLITYMRTDSTRIADEARDAAAVWIAARYGKEFLPEKPKDYKKSKDAQDAHEAIRPTQIMAEYSPEKLKGKLARDQFMLYELIWRRFVASQMTKAVYDSTTVDVGANGHVFRAFGQVEKFAGFTREYVEGRDESDEEGGQALLPQLAEGEALAYSQWQPKQHFTQPPPAYTEASLIRELEAKGIGRPSTYAQIIDTLRRRKYVLMDKRRFTPSDIGSTVNNILVREFPAIFNVEFTSHMEAQLDRVETGAADWLSVLNEFYGPFNTTLEKVQKNTADLKKSLYEASTEVCEKCGKPMIVRWGRNGKFIACSGYPACTNTKPLKQDEEDAQVPEEPCPSCGKKLVLRHGRSGRFIGCSGYPACRFVKPLTTNIKCPEPGCTGMITERRTRQGRIFYGCSQYPKCTFAIWQKPVNRACPTCSSPYLVEKTSKVKGDFLYCPKCKSKIQEEIKN